MAEGGDLDLAGVLDQMTECPICLSQFELPRVLPCQHTFCKACLESLVNRGVILCPTCRRQYTVQDSGVEMFPPNVTISELIELQHSAQVRMTMSREDSANELQQEIGNLEKGIDVLKDLQDDSSSSYRDEKKSHALGHISQVFKQYHDVISNREQNLKEKVCNIIDKSTEEEDKWQSKVSDITTEAEEVVSLLRECVSPDGKVKKDSALMQKSTRISENILELLRGQPPSMSFHFTHGSQSLMNHLSDLGTLSPHTVTLHQHSRRLSQISSQRTTAYLKVDYYPDREPLHSTDDDISIPKNFSPFGISTTPNGNIVTTDIENHCVYVFDPTLMLVKRFGEFGDGEGQLNKPTGVAVSRMGHVVVADQLNNRVVVFTLDGDFQYHFGKRGHQLGQLIYPIGLVVDSRDLVYVCDSGNFRIQVFQVGGCVLYSFGDRESLTNPPMFTTVTTDGRLLVSDDKQYIRFYKLPSERDVLPRAQKGKKKETAEVPKPRELYKIYMSQPAGLAVDRLGNLVVGNGSGHVVVIRDTGEVVCEMGTCGKAPGQFVLPRDVTITENRHLVIADSVAGRIQIFSVTVTE